jgi:lipopolysaccharide biosynthesis glycosyltransferase
MSQFNNSSITIACAADDAYAMPMAVMLRSVLENIPSDQKVCIFAIDAGIKETSKKKILSSLGNNSVDFVWIEKPTISVENLPIHKKVSPHVNRVIYYRLMLADLLPDSCEQVIYLDSDLIALKSLEKLWEIEIGENYVMAVQDPAIPFISSPYGLKKYQDLNIPPNNKYFNTGVLLINLRKWRDENIGTKLIQYLEENKEDVQHHDQDAMNAIFARQWGELHLKWNQTPQLFEFSSWKESPYEELDFTEANNDPCIVHFASSSKPWNSYDDHPSRDLFYRYLDMTSWSGWRFTFWTRVQKKLKKAVEQMARIQVI